MSTRIFLPSTGTASITPAFDAGWDRTNQADRINCVTVKIGTAMASFTGSNVNTGLDNQDQLRRQYISAPLSAQTISGTVKGQMRNLENNSAANFSPAIVIKVFSGDGLTERGTLFAEFSDDISAGVEYSASTLTNRQYPASVSGTLTDVVAQDGDVLVIELGNRKNSAEASSRTYTFSWGDDAASDLPEDTTTTTADNPWIEFSADITFQTAGTLLPRLCLLGAG